MTVDFNSSSDSSACLLTLAMSTDHPPVDSLCVDCYYSRWLKTVLVLELIQRSEEKRLWFDSFLTLTVFDSVLLFLSLLLWWWPTVVSLPQEEKKKQMFIFRRRQESEKYKFFKLSTEKKKQKLRLLKWF